jgi:hypothetical protein
MEVIEVPSPEALPNTERSSARRANWIADAHKVSFTLRNHHEQRALNAQFYRGSPCFGE